MDGRKSPEPVDECFDVSKRVRQRRSDKWLHRHEQRRRQLNDEEAHAEFNPKRRRSVSSEFSGFVIDPMRNGKVEFSFVDESALVNSSLTKTGKVKTEMPLVNGAGMQGGTCQLFHNRLATRP